jgi:diaminopimelate epimerase
MLRRPLRLVPLLQLINGRFQRVNITKIVGTGNDFLFVDARDLSRAFPRERRSALAMKLCDRHFGAGADGLVFVEPSAGEADLSWDFYNNDGSIAEMCGNASRCMGRWAQLKLGLEKVSFETMAGRVRTEVVGDQIASSIEYLKIEFKELEFQLNGSKATATLVNTGVPHAIFPVAAIEVAQTSQAVIQALRFHEGAGPRGTNVTFVAPHGQEFETVTFERGIEDFTLSCGTGVLAAAAVVLKEQPKPARAKLTTPGGPLEVSYGQNWSGAVLTGPALFIFDAVLNEDLLR